MDVKKIYSPDNATATLICEQCGKTRVINIAAVKSNPQKVRCSCSHEFFISIEVRKFYRKHTRLPGEYVNLSEKTSHRPDKHRMIVENVSRGGVGFRTERPHHLRVQDMLQVTFHLDDAKGSEITKRAVVRRAEDYAVGAEFLDLDTTSDSNRALGFYLMPR